MAFVTMKCLLYFLCAQRFEKKSTSTYCSVLLIKIYSFLILLLHRFSSELIDLTENEEQH